MWRGRWRSVGVEEAHLLRGGFYTVTDAGEHVGPPSKTALELNQTDDITREFHIFWTGCTGQFMAQQRQPRMYTHDAAENGLRIRRIDLQNAIDAG